MRAAPRSNMVCRYGSVDGGHSLPAFRELIGSRKFRIDDGTPGGLDINEEAFGEWAKTHTVFLDGSKAEDDQKMLVWHAITHGGEAKAARDKNEKPWDANVSGHWYYGSSEKRILIKTYPSAILVLTGAFNPIHNGHLHMLDSAREQLKVFYDSILGIVSPSHDEYVSTKSGALNWQTRCEMAELAVTDRTYDSVDKWECSTLIQGEWIDYPEVVEHFVQTNTDVYYVVGQDHYERHVRHTKRMNQTRVIVVPRTDADLSSTKVRETSDFATLCSMVPQKVAVYIRDHHLYSMTSSVSCPMSQMSPDHPTMASTFTLTTQNCLYATSDDHLCGWETEMISRTEKYGDKAVREVNLPWKIRVERLVKNIRNDSTDPDIVCLQEATPKMVNDVKTRLQATYDQAHSANGMWGAPDGQCWVLWKKSVFEVIGSAIVGSTDNYTRYVVVTLRHLRSASVLRVASVHLPASGNNTDAVKEILKSVSTSPSLICGDFNVEYNPFQGFNNISGQKPTFYNDYDHPNKFDWVVGSGIEEFESDVNNVKPEEGRWPNKFEGSDHTAIRMKITLPMTVPPPAPHSPPPTQQALTPTSFRARYPSHYAPPQWPIDVWDDLEGCRKSVRLYYQASDKVNEVKTCASQRDVVNIGMSIIVQDGKNVSESHSGYSQLWKKDSTKLPPNFALYMKTPVSFNKDDYEEHPEPLQYRHVINVIGYGFDSQNQPDYQYFSKRGWGKLQHHLTTTMRYVFQCAHDLKLETVVLSYIGGGAFGSLFPRDYEPAYLNMFVEAVKDGRDSSNFTGGLELMGADQDLINALGTVLIQQVRTIGRIPAVWKGTEASSKLFVNAWDPHSYAGNGNKGDNSLDGYVGRHSAVSYLSCVELNPHILENTYALPLLRVATFNVAGYCQTLPPKIHPDQKRGSEEDTVERMIKANAPKWGEYAAEFMASQCVDLLGVQEMVSGNGQRFAKFMGQHYRVHQPKSNNNKKNRCACLYNTATLGDDVVSLGELNGNNNVRAAAGIYVPRLKLVFLCIWLNHDPHKRDALDSLDVSLQTAVEGKDVRRVIATMDSNDDQGILGVIRLCGFTLNQAGPKQYTCAEDSGFAYPGDYIYDSQPEKTVRYGVPTLPYGWTPKTQLMSDHLPIVCDTQFV